MPELCLKRLRNFPVPKSLVIKMVMWLMEGREEVGGLGGSDMREEEQRGKEKKGWKGEIKVVKRGNLWVAEGNIRGRITRPSEGGHTERRGEEGK